jgi:two-component system cell cycle response regulator DivK
VKILVADDEPDLRDSLKLLLELRGHHVCLAVNGQDAVDMALHERPDVVLMDVRMPVMDGITATRILHTNPDTASIPVICTSAFFKENYLGAEALRAGCIELLAKPMEWKRLEDLLERLGGTPVGH